MMHVPWIPTAVLLHLLGKPAITWGLDAMNRKPDGNHQEHPE